MTRNEIILGLVVLVLVVYSLVVSLVVPRRNPSFPGKRLGLFLGVTAVLVAGTLAAVQVIGGEEAEEAEAAEVAEATDGEPSEEPGGPAQEPAPGPPPPEGEEPPGDPAAGAVVWEEAGCGGCHTLAAAGSAGTIGPNLDESMPSFELAVDRVTNGQGQMPAFAGQLTDQQINDVAAFVTVSTAG